MTREDLLTDAQVAASLNLEIRQFQHALRSGMIPPPRLVAGRRRWTAAQLRAVMGEQAGHDPAAAEDELEADDDAAPESTDDPAERIATLKERIDMLETQIAELTTASAVEEEIIDEDDLNKTSVDERVKDDE